VILEATILTELRALREDVADVRERLARLEERSTPEPPKRRALARDGSLTTLGGIIGAALAAAAQGMIGGPR